MGKIIVRIMVVIVMTAAILLLAREGIAWAGTAQAARIESAPQAPVAAPASAIRGGNPGTVQPPPTKISITHTGSYSVRGFCDLTVTITGSGISATADLVRPLPTGVPPHPIRYGCTVTFYSGNSILAQLAPNGTVQICFAAVPHRTMTIAFYDLYAPTPTWTTLTTTVTNGIACANGSTSGIYAVTFK